MFPRFRLALGVMVVLAAVTAEARAQYYPGYGRYGWGGWGGGSTGPGDFARGLGFYNIGAGIYNRQTAIAASINTDTVMRWNQYLWMSQLEVNRRERLRQLRRQARVNATAESIYLRLRDNPTASDVANGDALNLILDQLTDPRIHSSALRLAKDPIKGDVVDDIPFQNASEAITISLNQLTAQGAWPRALMGDEFIADRKAYQQAIAEAVKEDIDEDGQVSTKTLDNLRALVSKIRHKLEANAATTNPDDYRAAQNYVKTLAGMNKMLQSPQIDKVIAELQKIPQTTLGSLLGFMHTYNLRFGPAKTPAQRTVYERLYPMMVVQRDKIYKDAGIDDSQVAAKAKGQPTDFFEGMHLDHLEGKTPAPPPAQ